MAGAEAKRISNEISLLSVFQSAEMILQSHAPSNLSNLIAPAQAAQQSASQPAAELSADQAAQPALKEGEKDEGGFLRPDLRGDIQGAKVQCLGCSTEGKKVFRTAALWNWNLHCQRVHTKFVAAPLETQVTQQESQRDDSNGASSDTCTIVGERAQPARQYAVQRDVTHDAGSDNGRVVGKGGASFSKASTESAKFLQGAPKEQGSSGSRDVSNMPSRKPVSEESQASLRANLESSRSRPAVARKNSNAKLKFSTKGTGKKA